MSLGIGLAGFVTGLEGGIQAREAIDNRLDKRRSRNARDQINADARGTYDAAVEAGTEREGNYVDFWNRYALPKLVSEALERGDLDEARELRKWGESEATQRGVELHQSALLKAQTGDYGGAFQDAISLSKINGYLQHDYELQSQDEIVGPNEELLGYRLTFKTGKGEFTQDVMVDDVPRLIATFTNPVNAFKTQQDMHFAEREREQKESQRQKERGEDIEDYERRKQIDQRYKSDDADHGKAYKDAFENRMENDIRFGNLPREEQDSIVRADLAAQDDYVRSRQPGLARGASSPTPENLVIDTGSGLREQTPQQDQPKPSAQPPQQRSAPTEQPSDAPGLKPPKDQVVTNPEIEKSRAAIAQGADPAAERKRLIRMGIDPSGL